MPRHSASQQPSWLRPRVVVAIAVATAGLATAIWLPTRNDTADAAERDRSGDSRFGRSLPAFADDFTGPFGSTVDPAKWGLRTDRARGGTQFSESNRNVRLDGNGNLVLVLRAEDGGFFSAARLFSRGFLRGTSGHVEARVKAPSGRGLQPAVELVGMAQPNAGKLNLLATPVTDGDFHTYAVDWKPGEVALSVDGQQIDQGTPAGFDTGQPFKLALSLAVDNRARDRFGPPAQLIVDSVSFSSADASVEPSEPPATEPTSPPATEPPATEPPASEPPASEPTSPPATEPTSPPTSPPAPKPTATKPTATKWATYTDYVAGQLVTYKGVVYQVQETHTSLPGWEPTALPALFKKI